MYAEIVSIGEELLSSESETLDTNSVFITKQVGKIGIRVLYKTTVGDDEQRITDVLKIALNRADVIITSGGLGPTVDDMTRQGVANAVSEPLELRQELLDDIAAKFARFGIRMSDNNRMQAYLPVGAKAIDNPTGTAPGFIVEHRGHVILGLPGVPREMKTMMEKTVIPYLREKLGKEAVIRTRILRTAGIGESLIDEQIGHLEKLSNPTVGLNAHSGQTDIRITARTATEADATAIIAAVETEIRQKLGHHIFGVDQEPLEGAFLAALNGRRVAVVEIGTEDGFRRRVESIPGGADYLDLIDPVIVAQMRADYPPNVDLKVVAEEVAAAILAQTGNHLAVCIISEPNTAAFCVTNGTETRGRSYGYGVGPELASGWGLSMAWYIASKK